MGIDPPVVHPEGVNRRLKDPDGFHLTDLIEDEAGGPVSVVHRQGKEVDQQDPSLFRRSLGEGQDEMKQEGGKQDSESSGNSEPTPELFLGICPENKHGKQVPQPFAEGKKEE